MYRFTKGEYTPGRLIEVKKYPIVQTNTKHKGKTIFINVLYDIFLFISIFIVHVNGRHFYVTISAIGSFPF